MFGKLAYGLKSMTGQVTTTSEQDYDDRKKKFDAIKAEQAAMSKNLEKVTSSLKDYASSVSNCVKGFKSAQPTGADAYCGLMDKVSSKVVPEFLLALNSKCMPPLGKIKLECDEISTLVTAREAARMKFDLSTGEVKKLSAAKDQSKVEAQLNLEKVKLEQLTGEFETVNTRAKARMDELFVNARDSYLVALNDFFDQNYLALLSMTLLVKESAPTTFDKSIQSSSLEELKLENGILKTQIAESGSQFRALTKQNDDAQKEIQVLKMQLMTIQQK